MENSGQREVELKYRLADETLLATLREDDRFLDRFNLGSRRCQQTVDMYWDTTAYALTRGGFGLRTRRQDGRWLVTLKELALSSSSALADRVEVETPLDEATLHRFLQKPRLGLLIQALAQADWPPSAWQQVRLRGADPALRPLAVLQQRRDKGMLIHLDDGIACAIGELSLDAVQVYAPSSALSTLLQLDNRAPAATFCEVEIEATAADQIERVRSLAAILAEDARFSPSQSGKAESALRLLSQRNVDGGRGIEPSMPMAEAGRLIWRQQLAEVLLNEVGVRCRQDEDAVHDLRVAIRRMRAAQRIVGRYFDEKAIKSNLRTLSKTAKILGTARDLDVALSLLDSYKIELPAVRKRWQQDRAAAYARARRWLTSKRYNRFIAAFDRFCRNTGMEVRAENEDAQVRHVLPAEIFAHYTAMRAYEDRVDGAPLPLLHELRIEGKRLRYALEFVAHLLDAEIAPGLIADLKALQDRLGAINDAAVMGERLRRFAEEHPSVSVDQALAHLHEVIENERAALAPLWAAFVSMDTRKRLALAIAHL